MSEWQDHDPDLDEQQGSDPLASPKRRAGRPKGSRNRPKDSILTAERLKQLYDRFSPYLTDGQKGYIQGVIDGTVEVDCVREMELLVRQMSLLFQEAATFYFQQGRVSQDLGKFADSLRMAIKDLGDLREDADEKSARKQEEDGLVQFTERGSAMARIEALIGGGPAE